MWLMQGDCLEKMKEIPEHSVDMILADLPYGSTNNRWDSVIPFEPLWDCYHKVIKRGGAICLFGQMPFSAALCISNKKEFRYEWIWEKSRKCGHLNANKMPMRKHEQILVFYDSLPVYNPQFEHGNPYKKIHGDSIGHCYTTGNRRKIEYYDGKVYPSDVLHIKHDYYVAIHPTQKPVALLEYLIKTYTNEGETVLDNVMGSGSTGVACVNAGRDFIGIELDENYFCIAENRIREAQENVRKENG